MKLYYSPGACSLSPHIALKEAGISARYIKIVAGQAPEDGSDYSKINPNGYVPALVLDDGQIITEGTAIVQYIADQVPNKQLAPPAGTLERYRLMSWLNFISTELHAAFSPLFHTEVPDACKALNREQLAKRLHYVNDQLNDKPFLMGTLFSVADAYLFTMLSWAAYVNLDLTPWPNLVAYSKQVAARPAVQEALIEEGLLQA